MSVIRKLAGQTAIYGLSSIIGRVVVWGLTPLYTQYMHKSEYGVFSDLYSWVTYFLVILTFGMETAFFRFAKADKQDTRAYDQSFLFTAWLGLGFCFLLAGANPLVSRLLGYEERPLLLWMVTAITLLDVLTAMPMAKLRFDERPLVFAGISLANIAITVLMNILFVVVLELKTVEYVFLANLIASLLKFLMLVAVAAPWMRNSLPFIRDQSETRLFPSSWKIDKEILYPMATFGFFIMLAGLSGMINQNSDVNFIIRVWGDQPREYLGQKWTGEELGGVFSANKKLAVLILLVTQAFRYAAEPFFFRHAKESGDRSVYARVFHFFMLASFATGMLIASFAHELVSFRVFGFYLIHPSYHAGLSAVPMMIASFILFGAYTNFSIWYKLSRQVRFGLLFSLIGTFIIILLNLMLIPGMAFSGANISTFIGYLVMTLLTYFVGQKYFPIPYRIDRTLIHAGIFMAIWYLNTRIGEGTIGDLIFFKKLVVSLCGIGLVWMLERAVPVRFQSSATV